MCYFCSSKMNTDNVIVCVCLCVCVSSVRWATRPRVCRRTSGILPGLSCSPSTWRKDATWSSGTAVVRTWPLHCYNTYTSCLLLHGNREAQKRNTDLLHMNNKTYTAELSFCIHVLLFCVQKVAAVLYDQLIVGPKVRRDIVWAYIVQTTLNQLDLQQPWGELIP